MSRSALGDTANLTILDKNGDLPNTSTWIGFTPQRHIGAVILCTVASNRPQKLGILHALAQDQSKASTEGESNPEVPAKLSFHCLVRQSEVVST